MIQKLKKSLKIFSWLAIAACLVFSFLALTLSVSKEPTLSDQFITELILNRFAPEAKKFLHSKPRNFEEEIRAIQMVQDAVLKTTPINEGIPNFHTRELVDIWTLHKGLCYDRSRGIEKIAIQMGFRVRHVSIYALQKEGIFHTLLAQSVPSHAVTEIKTSKGWLMVESNDRWISLDMGNTPVSIAEMVRHPRVDGYRQGPPNKIFQAPFVPVYGLYSRHGQFYPPFTYKIALPDVNYRDIFLNLGNENPYLGLQF